MKKPPAAASAQLEDPDGRQTTPSLWSAIQHAKDPADPKREDAWTKLVNRYKPAIIGWMRRDFPRDAEELTQDFIGKNLFQRLIPSKTLTPEVGFRTCLYRALGSFKVDEQRRRFGKKPRPGQNTVSLDEAPQESATGVDLDPAGVAREFDRIFARHAFDRAFDRVRMDYTREAKAEEFELLNGLKGDLSDEEIALRLGGIKPNAVRARRHRLRNKLQEALLEEIAELVDPNDVPDEFRDLRDLL